jgi:saccharopine dehydrogenase-like NADP-dependent oxidoreductase
LHLLVAEDCVSFKRHFITASYLSTDMLNLHEAAIKGGILILNECGLDPGIDHMSAMEVIHRLQDQGCELQSFKSYTGGLVAPESNDNPWGYKFSWNPRNVIIAGQGTARYIRNGAYKYIPYNRLFTEIEKIEVEGFGTFDGYANRDSLAYRHHYGIETIPTLLRGTLRQSGYCRAWDVFVKLGLTDDTYKVEKCETLTYAELVKAFLPASSKKESLLEAVAALCGLPPDGEAMTRIKWTGILEDDMIEITDASPAMILQNLLEKKWKLEPHDKDMIVMQHQFEFIRNGQAEKLTSSLVVKGEDQMYTAMAKTVGLPLGIAASLILDGKLTLTGVHIPVMKEIYEPVLKELGKMGIRFQEK